MGKALFQSRTDHFLRKRSDSEDRERDTGAKDRGVVVEAGAEVTPAVEVDRSLAGGNLSNALPGPGADPAKLTPSNDGSGERMAPWVFGNNNDDLVQVRIQDAGRDEESYLSKPFCFGDQDLQALCGRVFETGHATDDER